MKIKIAKSIFGALAIIFALTGCSKNSDELASVSTTKTDSTKMFKIRGDNKYDVLGFGCDITGKYLDQDKPAYAVLDIDALFADNYIFHDNNVHTDVIINGGSTLNTLSTKLSAKLALTASVPLIDKTVFTEGFNMDFIGTYTSSTKYSYAYAQVNCYYFHCAVRQFTDITVLQNYLTPAFKNDLLTKSCDQIIALYGTHIYTDIYTGGQLNCQYKSCIFNNSDELAVSLGANAGVKDVCGYSASATYTKSATAQVASESMDCHTVGGSNIAPFTWTPGSGITFDFTNWSKTVSESNPHSLQLIDIGDKSLVAIYEFVADPVKKAALKTAVDNYIISKAVTVLPAVPLHRYCYKGNHLYTTNYNEKGAGSSSSSTGWKYEGIAAYVFNSQQPGTKAFNRYARTFSGLFQPTYYDHFYTTDARSAVPSSYASEGIACYIYEYNNPSHTVPLYQFYKSSIKDHFYTTNSTEGYSNGYTLEEDKRYYVLDGTIK